MKYNLGQGKRERKRMEWYRDEESIGVAVVFGLVRGRELKGLKFVCDFHHCCSCIVVLVCLSWMLLIIHNN